MAFAWTIQVMEPKQHRDLVVALQIIYRQALKALMNVGLFDLECIA